MRVIAYDSQPSQEARDLGIEFVPLETLLSESDFVSVHVALTSQTRGLFGEAQLRRMKPSAYLINTSRGPVVNEPALLKALQEQWIAGAALDVYEVEPLASDHPLRTAPNILLSPHQSSFGRETGARVSAAAAQAIVDLKNGRRPRWVVDPTVYDSSLLRVKMA